MTEALRSQRRLGARAGTATPRVPDTCLTPQTPLPPPTLVAGAVRYDADGREPLRIWNDCGVARVTGIGGFFFRARDPEAINRWYGEHLGVIMLDSRTYDDPGWFQDRGETVFSAIDAGSPMPGSPEKSWLINFRVDDLDGMVERLRAAGIDVQPHEQEYPNGRFAELADPEGNRVQLWEPNAVSVARDPGPSTATAPDVGSGLDV